jgi:hypothetical protein
MRAAKPRQAVDSQTRDGIGMKNVSIIEKATKKVVATIPIEMTVTSHTPSKEEYEAAAWEAAVDDRWVDPDRVSDYSFEVEDAATTGAQSSPPK